MNLSQTSFFKFQAVPLGMEGEDTWKKPYILSSLAMSMGHLPTYFSLPKTIFEIIPFCFFFPYLLFEFAQNKNWNAENLSNFYTTHTHQLSLGNVISTAMLNIPRISFLLCLLHFFIKTIWMCSSDMTENPDKAPNR